MRECFIYFNPENLTEKRKKDFEGIILMLLGSSDQNVWTSSIESVLEYYRLTKQDEYIKELMQGFADELNKHSDMEQDEDYEKKIKIIIMICKLGIPKLNNVIETLIFTENLKPWQLDIISNTAQIFGSKMYSKGILKSGLTFFADQYVEQYRSQDKGELMLYTIKNLVESLTPSHESMFVSQNIDFIKRYLDDPHKNLCLMLLSLHVLNQFYEFNCQDQTSFLPSLIDNLTQVLCDDSETAPKIFEALGKFLKVFSFYRRPSCSS